MNVIRPIVSVVTALAFFVQTTGLAYAQDVQPVPYTPSQPVPLPPAPASPPPPPPAVIPAPPVFAPVPPAQTYGPAPAPGAPAPGYAPVRPPVYAGGPPGDTVYLKDGGLMRGTLIEMLPNDHVTVQLPTGQTATIEWGRIDHIERATLQVAPIAPYAPAPPRERRHHRPGAGATAFVHVDADPGVILQSISPGSGRWQVMCTAPCDVALPLDHEYRIAGEGIRLSRPFGLNANPGQHVLISVSAASRGAFAAGAALTAIGGVAVGIGLIVLVYGAAGCSQMDLDGDCIGSADTSAETAGGVIALVGVAVLVGGIILLASNARTRETQSVSELLPAPAPRPETGWLRGPVWHDATSSSGAPKPMGFPLFSRSF